jgi:hypothetical protein
MSTDGDAPALDGSDLAELRTQIDELKSVPSDQLVTPDVTKLDEVSEPEPSDAIEFDADDSTKGDEPAGR